MKFTKLVPNVFYEDIQVGIRLFIDCLEFSFGYKDLESANPCCVVQKEGLALFLFQNKEFADKDRPEMRLHTDDIHGVHAKIARTHPHLLHPNLSKPTLRPWGALEFGLKDESNVCIIIQQWPEKKD